MRSYLNTGACGKKSNFTAFYAGFSTLEPQTATKYAFARAAALKKADLMGFGQANLLIAVSFQRVSRCSRDDSGRRLPSNNQCRAA